MKGSFKRNLPSILSYIGVLGVATTAALSAIATPKAMRLVEEVEYKKGKRLTSLEVLKTSIPCYIPTMLSGFATMACIIGADKLNIQRQASILSAYITLDRLHKEYSNVVKENIGEDKESKIRETVIANQPFDECSRQLFYDMYSGQYFESVMDQVIFDDGLECYLVDTSTLFQDRENLS